MCAGGELVAAATRRPRLTLVLSLIKFWLIFKSFTAACCCCAAPVDIVLRLAAAVAAATRASLHLSNKANIRSNYFYRILSIVHAHVSRFGFEKFCCNMWLVTQSFTKKLKSKIE